MTTTTFQAAGGRPRPAVVAEIPAPRRAELTDSLTALGPGGDSPLHLRLRAVLDLAVEASGLVHGDRIWSESQLMRHYGVSRHVVRQSLNQLVLEGRLSVRKGAGYFVNRRRVVKHLPSISSITADLAATGEAYSVEVLEVGPTPAADEVEEQLGNRRRRVHRVRRIGRLEGEPVALLTGAYPSTVARVLNRQAVSGVGVHEALSAHGRRPHRADVVLGVTFASAGDSGLLEVAEGTPLVQVRCRTRTVTGELIEVTRELYRSDRFEFSYAAEAGAGGWGAP